MTHNNLRASNAAKNWQVVLHDPDYVDTVRFDNKMEAIAYANRWKAADPAHSAIIESSES